MLWCSIERMLTWGWISSGTTEATSSFPHSGASEICSFRECSAELLGKKKTKTGNSGQKGGLTFTGSFSGCPPLSDISPFSMSIARKQKARSFSHPEICVLLLYPEKG